jgi:ribosomal protein L7/L12
MLELSGAASVLSALLVISVLLRLMATEKRLAAVSRIDAKLDLLLNQAGIVYDPYKDLPAQVVQSLQRGDKLEAIKQYREATGRSLKESKEFIEEVQRRVGA